MSHSTEGKNLWQGIVVLVIAFISTNVAFATTFGTYGLIVGLLNQEFSGGRAVASLGIALVMLTMGMAVDANVLIYERIREEIDSGARDLREAIREGYNKVFSTIIDANLTNLIVCFVLCQMDSTSPCF